MKLCSLFLALCSLTPALLYGAGNDSVATPELLEHSLEEARGWRLFNPALRDNPALAPWLRSYSIGSVAVGWVAERQSQPFIIELGDGDFKGVFDARAYIRSGKNILWGEASYANGKSLNRRWNESSEFERLYPYLTADSAGGDLCHERYAFAGGYARDAGRLSWGVEGGYAATLAYRRVDPRPRIISGDLSLRAAIGLRLFADYRAALALSFGKFRETSSISFMSELGVSKIYHMTGLGSHYVRFDGTGMSVYNNCFSYGASLDLAPESGCGGFFGVSLQRTTQDHVIDDLNRLPMASLWHNALSGNAGWKQCLGRHALAGKASMEIYRRHGSEAIFGDSQSSTFPQIDALEMYADNFHSEALEILYSFAAPGWELEAAPFASLSHRRTIYRTPRRDRLIDTASAGLRLHADGKLSSRWGLAGGCSAERRFSGDSHLFLPDNPAPDTEEYDLQETVRLDFENMASAATALKGNVTLSFLLNQKFVINLGGSISYISLDSGPHSLAWSALLSLSF